MTDPKFLEVATRLAHACGGLVRWGSLQPLAYLDDTVANVKTKVDDASDELIVSTLRGQFPDHDIYTEESGWRRSGADTGYEWICDPVDGSSNVKSGIPYCGVSIALRYQGVAKVGVVYQPFSDELFDAVMGGGARLNGQPIRIGRSVDPSRSLIIVNRGVKEGEKERFGDIFQLLTRHVRSIRILGATAVDLCYVAAGRLDAMIDNHCQEYDCIAGALIAAEAGAKVTNFDDQPRRQPVDDLLVANPELHSRFLDIMEPFRQA